MLPTETVKFSGKVQVWDQMFYNGLSDLLIIPRGQSTNATYYIEEILSKLCSQLCNEMEKLAVYLRGN